MRNIIINEMTSIWATLASRQLLFLLRVLVSDLDLRHEIQIFILFDLSYFRTSILSTVFTAFP